MEKFNLRYLKPNAFIFIIAFLAISIFLANQFIENHWRISVSIVGIIGGLLAFINIYLWNKKPFSWMYAVPDFSGRYKGTLLYEFRNDKNEIITDVLEHIKIITQNGSDVVISSWTKKKDGTFSSKSTSIEASVVREKDKTYYIIYNYLNDGNFELNFPPHYGTEVLKLIQNGKERQLIGRYYTERMPYQTKGKIELNYIGSDLTHIN